MKKLIFIISVLMFSVATTFAESNPQELSKEQKALLQAKLDSIVHQEAIDAINNKAFTLEADQVTFKYGQTAYVASNTNFVSLNGDDAVVQVAFNIPLSGLNGIGGITVDGTVSNYDIKSEKNGDTLVSMSVTGVGISATVYIRLYKDSDKASVSILPNFNSNNLSLSGHIVPLHKSNVFKGRSL